MPDVAAPRSLGFWRCWGLVVGGAIGSSVFMMPAVLAPYGYLGLLSLATATIGAMALGLTMGHMARRVTVSGGPYAYAQAAFGDLPGFFVAWGFWISYWVSLVAIAIGFTAYAGAFVPAIAASPRLAAATALAILWITVAINCAGTRESGIVCLATSVFKIVPIILVCFAGVWLLVPGWPPPPTTPGNHVLLFTSAYALTFWMFYGVEAATIAAEDVIDPARTLPRALVTGTATVGAVYMLTSLVSLNALPPEVLAASSSPLTDVGRRLLGETGGILISLGALVSTAGCLNVNMLGTGQIAMAAARDGLFPAIFARISARHTPAMSYLLVGTLASALLIFSFSESLVGAWTFVSLLATLTGVPAFAMAALASLAYQRREDAVTARESIPAVATLVTCAWIVATAGITVVLWGLALLTAGLPVYLLMIRSRIGPTVARSQPVAYPIPTAAVSRPRASE